MVRHIVERTPVSVGGNFETLVEGSARKASNMRTLCGLSFQPAEFEDSPSEDASTTECQKCISHPGASKTHGRALIPES